MIPMRMSVLLPPETIPPLILSPQGVTAFPRSEKQAAGYDMINRRGESVTRARRAPNNMQS